MSDRKTASGLSSKSLKARASTPTLNGEGKWEERGRQIWLTVNRSAWQLGDWWAYGEDQEYGQRKEIAERIGFNFQSCANAGSVSRAFPTSRRREVSWAYHAEVARLEPVDQEVWLDRVEEHGWTREQLRAELKALPASPTEPAVLPAGTYRTVVADPPWQYSNTATRGAAEDHYATLTVNEICDLEVPAADDAHLYLWTTNAFLRDAFNVVDAWGFTYKTCLTWVKPQIGMGNYFRNSTEHILFGLRGQLATQRNDVPTWFEERRGKHSAKPDSFLDLVESCSPGPYLEMFARRRRMGWDVWGNEA